ncbi:MAG: DUF3153 domain-containing protein [Acidaminococcaceae bacterium]
MKKLVLIIGMLLISLAAAGCVKGEVVMEVSRFAAADLQCKIVTVPFLTSQLNGIRQDFEEDGFAVADVSENNMYGFTAHRHFDQIGQLQDIKIIKGFKLDRKTATSAPSGSVVTETQEAKQKPVVMKSGFLFDTITVNTNLDLRQKNQSNKKEEEWIIKNLLNQIDLRFVLKLPTAVDSSNASRSPDGGKTLVWNLVLGEDNALQAQVTYLNPFKAAGILLVVVLAGVGGLLYKIRKQHR